MFKIIHKTSKYLLLAFLIFSIAVTLLFWDSSVPADTNYRWMMTSTVIFVLLVWIDAFKVLGWKALWFIALTSLISFGSEFLGVNMGGGGTFGGTYDYNTLMGPMLGGVPIVVISMWTALVYICYRIAVVISGRKKDIRDIYERILEYFIIALIAGLAAVSWDLVWDPLAVKIESWTWHNPGPYFGIPTSNFVGWIVVTFLSCFIFEWTSRIKRNETKDITTPFLGYLYLLVSTFMMARGLAMHHFSLLVFILMSPYLLILVLLKLKKIDK